MDIIFAQYPRIKTAINMYYESEQLYTSNYRFLNKICWTDIALCVILWQIVLNLYF